jgi:polysaccharide export outer membrane protein
VRVAGDTSLSGDIAVDDKGYAAIPRLGTIRVDSVSPDSVRRLIRNTYGAWLVNPSIEVTFPQRLRVLGAVRNPNLYNVDLGLTVADVIALAGGVTDDGSYDDVQLIHGNDKSNVVHVTSVSRLADLGVYSGDEVYVPRRNWFARNATALAASTISGVAIFLAAVIR